MRNPLKFAGVPRTNETISARRGPKFTILWGHVEEILLFNKFFPIVDICISCEHIDRQRGPNCVTLPNFVEIGHAAEEICRFFDFSRWRPPPSWIFKFWSFHGRNAVECQAASLCQILSKSVKPRPRYGDFWIFPRWWPSTILDLWCVCLDHPRRLFSGLYHCAKFGWNQYSRFDNTQLLLFRDLGLKTPIHGPKLGFLEYLTP